MNNDKNTLSLWAARDKDGTLCLYNAIPIRCRDTWRCSILTGEEEDGRTWDSDFIEIDPSNFPMVKWEDGPVRIEFNFEIYNKDTL